jgi:NTE family protein
LTVTLNLALQGGGAHGAFTWGVLDRLLEEESIAIEGISGTSAGAMNAAAVKVGWVRGGRQGAKAALADFWGEIGGRAALHEGPLLSWLTALSPTPDLFSRLVEVSPAYLAGDALTRALSPYQLNPLNIHPMRPIVEGLIADPCMARDEGPKLFVSATNVRTGKIRVFTGDEITPDALLASACLPTLYQAIEIHDPETGRLEAYWDGGYMGNPALFPMFYRTTTPDYLIVHINPIHREEVPRTAQDILNRINEISFNSSLLAELRAIDFVARMIDDGTIPPGRMKKLHVHSVSDDALMTQLGAATKLFPDAVFLNRLREAGRKAMDGFLHQHGGAIGRRGTMDLRRAFSRV